jgi:hypothetical protein
MKGPWFVEALLLMISCCSPSDLRCLNMMDLGSRLIKASVSLSERAHDLAYAPGAREIAIPYQYGSVGTWNPSTGCVRHPFKSVETYDNYHEGTAAVSPDRQTVFQGSDEGIIEP